MPITSSAKKSLRVSLRRADENKAVKLRIKNQVKTASTESLAAAYRIIDKAAKNHVIHANKAARLKSRLALRLAKESVAETKPTPAKTRRRKTKSA